MARELPITTHRPGRPYPLGATWDGEGVNFALFSEHAEKVELCFYDERGRRERQRITLKERTGHVWHVYLPQARLELEQMSASPHALTMASGAAPPIARGRHRACSGAPAPRPAGRYACARRNLPGVVPVQRTNAR
jgi:hypothetical protein